MSYLELDYRRSPYFENTMDVVAEYFEESDYCGGFVKVIPPEVLMGDVQRFAQHCEVAVDRALVYMLVHRIN